MIAAWLHLHNFDPPSWTAFTNVEVWWTSTVLSHRGRRKAMASLLMLVSWELWNERNARIFKHVSTMPTVVFDRIKLESRSWALAGAKHLGLIISGE